MRMSWKGMHWSEIGVGRRTTIDCLITTIFCPIRYERILGLEHTRPAGCGQSESIGMFISSFVRDSPACTIACWFAVSTPYITRCNRTGQMCLRIANQFYCLNIIICEPGVLPSIIGASPCVQPAKGFPPNFYDESMKPSEGKKSP